MDDNTVVPRFEDLPEREVGRLVKAEMDGNTIMIVSRSPGYPPGDFPKSDPVGTWSRCLCYYVKGDELESAPEDPGTSAIIENLMVENRQLRRILNQFRLVAGGFVSMRSAVDMLDNFGDGKNSSGPRAAHGTEPHVERVSGVGGPAKPVGEKP